MDPELVATATPEPGLRDAIVRPLIAFNTERAGPSCWTPFAIPVRDPATGEVQGGLWGGSSYDWLYVELLIVPATLRGRGLGTRMIRMAEDAARARGCIGVWLDTFGFQARGFYERLGYEVFGALEDHPRGSRRFFMSRRLDGGSGAPAAPPR